jgi:hypothetical protein
MNAPGWIHSCLAFNVPQSIQELALLVVTWHFGSRFEFSGVRPH